MASRDALPPFRLFTYGTLMLPEVMTVVCGVSLQAEKAVLADYCRRLVKNEVFPAIIEKKGVNTDGLLYRGIDREILERLDAYEGEPYCRREVRVTLVDGSEVCCFTYVLKDRHRHLVGDTAWDIALFRDRHLADYLTVLGTAP